MWQNSLGFGGLLGIGLLFASLVAYMTSVSEMASQVANAQSQVELASRKPVYIVNSDKAPIPQMPTLQTVKTLYQGFPMEVSLPRQLTRISELAKQRGLVLSTGDYRLKKLKKTTKKSDARLVQYEILFPVKGSYLAIRAWMKALLEQFPTLAFKSLEFRRENTLSPEVEAHLEMVLYVREGD